MPSTRTLTLVLTGCILVLIHLTILRGQWKEWSSRCNSFQDAARVKLAGVQTTVQAAFEANNDLHALIAELEPQQKTAEQEDKHAEKELKALTERYSKLKREKVDALDSFEISEAERLTLTGQVDQLDAMIADLLISQQNASKMKLVGGDSAPLTIVIHERKPAARKGSFAMLSPDNGKPSRQSTPDVSPVERTTGRASGGSGKGKAAIVGDVGRDRHKRAKGLRSSGLS